MEKRLAPHQGTRKVPKEEARHGVEAIRGAKSDFKGGADGGEENALWVGKGRMARRGRPSRSGRIDGLAEKNLRSGNSQIRGGDTQEQCTFATGCHEVDPADQRDRVQASCPPAEFPEPKELRKTGNCKLPERREEWELSKGIGARSRPKGTRPHVIKRGYPRRGRSAVRGEREQKKAKDEE